MVQLVGAGHKLSVQLLRLEQEFGLTPAARRRYLHATGMPTARPAASFPLGELKGGSPQQGHSAEYRHVQEHRAHRRDRCGNHGVGISQPITRSQLLISVLPLAGNQNRPCGDWAALYTTTSRSVFLR